MPTLWISSSSSLAQFLPRSSGRMVGPWPCGAELSSALRKNPFWVSAARTSPKPGDLGTHQTPLGTLATVEPFAGVPHVVIAMSSCCSGDSLPRVGSLQVVRVDVNVWNELVDDTAGRVYDAVGHLWGDSHGVSERMESRSCSLTSCSVSVWWAQSMLQHVTLVHDQT